MATFDKVRPSNLSPSMDTKEEQYYCIHQPNSPVSGHSTKSHSRILIMHHLPGEIRHLCHEMIGDTSLVISFQVGPWLRATRTRE